MSDFQPYQVSEQELRLECVRLALSVVPRPHDEQASEMVKAAAILFDFIRNGKAAEPAA